jgi:hypothetical protein
MRNKQRNYLLYTNILYYCSKSLTNTATSLMFITKTFLVALQRLVIHFLRLVKPA